MKGGNLLKIEIAKRQILLLFCSEIPLSYLTDNSAVHATDLLHTLLNRLKKLFHANADVKLPVPINFVAERYQVSGGIVFENFFFLYVISLPTIQAPTLSVTYNLLSEWIAPNENVEIVFEPEFVELLKQKGFSVGIWHSKK